MSQKKILFVDDEPIVATLMKSRIESHGFVVQTSGDGASALEKAKAWQPNFILLDVAMPVMDGFETCRRLKSMKETAHIPVILFTAVEDPQLETTAQEAGANKVVQKPFIDQVFKAIAEISGP